MCFKALFQIHEVRELTMKSGGTVCACFKMALSIEKLS